MEIIIIRPLNIINIISQLIDLTPKTKENITLEELKNTWMAKLNENCLFISAREKENIDELKELLYTRVKELHVQRFPYNDFLFQVYDEDINE